MDDLVPNLQDGDISMIPYERPLVEAVDKLVEFAKYNASPSKRVESESDWKVVNYIFELWRALCPNEYTSFIKSMSANRMEQQLRGGKRASISKEGSAMIQQQIILHPRFHDLFKAIYPKQPLTRSFVRTMWQRMPQFRVGDSL